MTHRLTLLIFLALFMALFSCNNADSSSAETAKTDTANIEQMEEEEHHHHDGEMTELALNNGQKWQLDATTTANYKLLAKAADALPAGAASFNQMKSFGDEVKGDLAKLVKECTMSGPDHEALHVWLSPVMRQMNSLTEATDSVVAVKVYDSLNHQIKVFDQYFDVK